MFRYGKASSRCFGRFSSVAVWIGSYACLIFFYRAPPALLTVALALAVWALYHLTKNLEAIRKSLTYLVFFLTPLLTFTGQIAVLTGFGGEGASLPWVGVSFVTAALALHIQQKRLDLATLCLNILQPARMDSGPVALAVTPIFRLGFRRLKYYAGWMLLGVFFYTVLATALAPF